MGDLAQSSSDGADFSERLESGEIDGFLLKPMNCLTTFKSTPVNHAPIVIYQYDLRNLGRCIAGEQSGEIGGLTRVRGFTQDDRHCFCTEEQVPQESAGLLVIGPDNFWKLWV